jgi:hypothetical protein
MLFVNVGELIAVFATCYQLIAIRGCDSVARWDQALLYSWGRFFSVDMPYAAYECAGDQVILKGAAILQLTCEFLLIALGLASLINMLSKGKEAASG